MQLTAIILHGFKSFAEKTALQILPGITAIVGPNGCGKCLTGDTPVVLADGRVVPIGTVVEEALARARSVQRLDDGVAALESGDGLEVLSLEPATLRLERRPIMAFIRREAPPYLLRVRTRSGREVVTTHYHPFFGLKGGALAVLTAEQLASGVRIAVPRLLPVKVRNGRALAEAVLTSFAPDDRIYVPHSPALETWVETARQKAGSWRRLAVLTGTGIHALRHVTSGQPVRAGVVARVAELVWGDHPPFERLASSAGATIRIPREVDGLLARFLGMLIAAGRTTASNQIRFVNSDPAVTAEFSRLARELFDVTPRQISYKATATDTLIYSRALCLVLERVFGIAIGGRSATKRVPAPIMTAGDELVAEFLAGLFEGDAYVHQATTRTGSAMPYLEYVTASRGLADDVTTLLLRLGIFALIRPRVRYAANTRARRRRTYYSVYVYGVEHMRRLAARVRFVGAKQARFDAAVALVRASNPNLDLVPGVAPLIRATVVAAGLKVKRLRGVSPRLAAYVEGRCEASRSSLAEVADLIEAHGTEATTARPLLRRLRALAESELYWDEVVSIERTPPPARWVYDLTVADTHNFVAGNVIVHNSNIAEAVRWALGEQSPKSLRGHRMEDVIFHGSASRKPLGMADASLVFTNDGTLPVPWGEVQVSRRLYRTGESEYLLNKNVCRLRDILDLFVGTGVNPKAYALMDQERLNHVLTSRPLDRRVLIEEAAGISRYKQQRVETMGKLDAARQNLVRVRDVMEEVKRQLGSLERQARKAQQYKAIYGEKQSLALSLLAAEHAGLAARERALAERMSGLRRDEEVARAALSKLAAREATEQTRIQESEHRLADLRQTVQKIQGELERLLERREQLGVQLRELAAEDVRVQEEARLIAERRAGVRAELDAKARVLAETVEEQRRRAKEVEASAARLETVTRDLHSAREQLNALRLEQLRVAGERSEITRAIGELREREHQLLRRHERLVAELEQCRAEAAELAARRATVGAEAARARAGLAAIAEERQRLESAVAECEARRAEGQAMLADLRLALGTQQSSLDALERLEREREGYGEAVRLILSGAAGESVRGVVGTVADLLEVPRGLEPAFEAVLGERLTWVVMERFEDAKAAVAFLDQRKAGRATFLPLDTLPRGNGTPAPQDGLRWAASLVGSAHPVLLRYLLGRVAVVSHLAEAEALWRRNGNPATYVTLSGEVLSATGRLSGGGAARDRDPVETSLLGRKRAIRDARAEADRLGREVSQSQARVEAVEAELQDLRSRLAALLDSIHREEVRCLGLDQDLARVVAEEERTGRHLETLSAEERQLLAEVEEARRVRDGLEAQVAAARRREVSLEQSLTGIGQAIERLEADERELLDMLTRAQVAAASLGERVEGLRRELGHLDETGRDLETRLAQSRARREQLAGRTADLELEQERTDRSARDAAQERDGQESVERAAVAAHQLLLDELREIRALVQGGEHEIARARDELHAAELEATEGRVHREELEQEARRSFGVEPAALAERYDSQLDLDAGRARLAELEAKLAALGPVNLVADEEYRELEERLAFLRTQHDDLVASTKDLEKALRGMTRTAHERFQEAFDAINRHFGEIFSRLFEGGHAELRLVPVEEGEGDPLETGVDLMAQPRGKRLQSVSLLSGGEKALTGLALLFAIFYHRPSPFCILDEVDAPLDDANIHRFLRVLRELSGQTQFVVITHNRKTMEAADVLYGITMEEPGLSRLVSVNLVEARV